MRSKIFRVAHPMYHGLPSHYGMFLHFTVSHPMISDLFRTFGDIVGIPRRGKSNKTSRMATAWGRSVNPVPRKKISII